MFVVISLSKSLYSHGDVERVRQIPGLTWTPGIPEQFKDMSLEEFKMKLIPMDLKYVNSVKPTTPKPVRADLPTAFDSRVEWPECANPVPRDQQQCGSCWAFSAVGEFSDRRCTYGIDKKRVQYSEEYAVACDTKDKGCMGGSVLFVHQFLKKTGVPTAECVSYKSGDGKEKPCPTKCDDGSELKLVKAKGFRLMEVDIEKYMEEIMEHGPIQGQFFVFEDFKLYTGGIYKHVEGEFLGGHAITHVGWGEENGVKYWIIRNSWGPSWGENGYFRMIRGENNSGNEMAAMAAKFE
uniref:Cathepsin B n=1 Tax=Trepomonas sp. PC1 TaxID=1076344 RepID=A0A146KD19_9EUKA|eukprot:JAP94720.1 Cathepsin B [Trepomonas sp. PC1]